MGHDVPSAPVHGRRFFDVSSGIEHVASAWLPISQRDVVSACGRVGSAALSRPERRSLFMLAIVAPGAAATVHQRRVARVWLAVDSRSTFNSWIFGETVVVHLLVCRFLVLTRLLCSSNLDNRNRMSADKRLNIEARRREKQASRARDARALADGSKSIKQLNAENGAFAFPNAKPLWSKAKPS